MMNGDGRSSTPYITVNVNIEELLKKTPEEKLDFLCRVAMEGQICQLQTHECIFGKDGKEGLFQLVNKHNNAFRGIWALLGTLGLMLIGIFLDILFGRK